MRLQPTSSNGSAAATGGTSPEAPLFVVWRRKWLVAITTVICAGLAVLASFSLPKVYETTATLWVSQDRGATNYDAVQASEVLARSYATVAQGENVAAQAAARLPGFGSGKAVQSAITVAPVEETQLLEITGEDRDPATAQSLTNTYAMVFRAYISALPEAGSSSLAVSNPAARPRSPARPQPALWTALGVLMGLLIGVGTAFLLERLDTRVRSTEELQELLGVPVLAHIPKLSASADNRGTQDAFSLLRTNLHFARAEEPLHSIAIVSAAQGDGKTSVALNLATAFAGLGQTVILVEGDMRRPELSPALLPAGDGHRDGLSNYLVGSASLEQVLYDTVKPNVLLVPAGPLPPAPSSLLESARGRRLLRDLESRAYVVIIDTPPLSVGSDASLLASGSSGAVLVTDLARSTKLSVRRAQEQLTVVGASLVGTVVNRSQGGQGPLSGYYAYYRDQPPVNGDRSARRRPGARSAGR